MRQPTDFLLNEHTVMSALYEVYDPELGVNIVDLGLVYGVDIKGSDVVVTMTLTTPGCPLHDTLVDAVNQAVRAFTAGVTSIDVDLVWDPPWRPELITPAGLRALGWQ